MNSFYCYLFIAIGIAHACPDYMLEIGYRKNSFYLSPDCITPENCKQRSFVIFKGTCIRACPAGTKYFNDSQTCFLKCPNDTIETEHSCVNASYCLIQNQVLYNGTCQNSCPTRAAIIENGICRSACSSDKVTNGTKCVTVEDCINETTGFIFNHSCVGICPQSARYVQNGVCYSVCPSDTVTYAKDKECFSNQACMKSGHVIFNGTCMTTCPLNAPYIVNGRCYITCPQNFVLNSTHCIATSDCIDNGYIYNNTCVKSCPASAKYHSANRCYSHCPHGYFIYGTQCVNKLRCISPDELYNVIFNGTCIQSCPNNAPFNNEGMCMAICPPGKFEKDRQCIDIKFCNQYHYNLYFKNTCVSNCPGKAPYISRNQCLSKCPYQEIIDGTRCTSVYDCTTRSKCVYNNTCLISCPTGTHLGKDQHCYSKCLQGTVANRTTCVPKSECTFIFEDHCVEMCPPRFNYSLQNLCLKQCPNNTFINGTNCIPNSKCSTQKIYNLKCMESCPSIAPYITDGQCMSQCPQGFRAFSEFACILLSKCKRFSNGSIIHNKTTCMTSCPMFSPIPHENNTCSKDCPKDEVADGARCISKYSCRGVVFNRKCLPSCPNEAPFKRNSNCYNVCPDDMVVKGKQCIYDFECKTVVYNGTCVAQCPKEAAHLQRKKCYASCPQNTVVDYNGTECINTFTCFSKNWFISDNACVPMCPVGYAVDSSKYCTDLGQSKRYAILTAVAILLSYVSAYFCIYNPNQPNQEKDIPARNEEENVENAVDELVDNNTRRRRRQPYLNDNDTNTGQMIIMNERQPVPNVDEPAVVMVHNSEEDTAADDVPLLCVGDYLGTDNNDDDALLFGNGSADGGANI